MLGGAGVLRVRGVALSHPGIAHGTADFLSGIRLRGTHLRGVRCTGSRFRLQLEAAIHHRSRLYLPRCPPPRQESLCWWFCSVVLLLPALDAWLVALIRRCHNSFAAIPGRCVLYQDALIYWEVLRQCMHTHVS